MLSIAKLRVGQEAYTLAGVAQSLDDYYTGRGEASGVWLGAGAERLGLSGDVSADDLRAVLAGLAPGSGGLTPDGRTVRTHKRRVPGFDLTFKAPKSVSALYAVSDDPRVQGAIIEAGDSAVRQALSWLEREAIRVRRGSGDAAYLNDLSARDPDAAEAARGRVLPGRGLVAATFRHRTSRAGDPLLHWHTLVANLVEGPDGRWGAFVHPELYRSVRSAGELFQTVLRGELTERLGVEWRPGRHVLEIAGVPQNLCDQFSKRSREIDAWLHATGTPDDPAGRQEAVLATRRGKPELEGERFDAAWKAEAAAAGWGPAEADALMASTTPRAAVDYAEVWRLPVVDEDLGVVTDVAIDPEEWIGRVGRGLTENDSTFTRAKLTQAVAARIGEGATAATVERVVARVLGSAQIVPIDDGPAPRWTTIELLAVERRFLHTARSTRDRRLPVAAAVVDAELDRVLGLGVDQETVVRTVVGSADAVSVLVGPAGTGKTYTLDAVRRVYEAAGHVVVGVAPSARAAHELQTDAHIASSTMHRLAGSWSRGYDLPNAGTVLVVDEAGMAGTRDLEHLVSHVVAAGGRVVLVGDHHQLPEVAAGGGFAALATDPTGTVAELTVNRRQQHAWEREALTKLRDGHVAEAVDAYWTHGRVAVADRAGMVDAAVDRWLDTQRNGHTAVLLAGTNEMVDTLNTAVRCSLVELGVLGDRIDAAGTLAVGERLMIRLNDYRTPTVDCHDTAVLNGQTGMLVAVTDAGLVVRMDHDGAGVVLPHDALTTGRVSYAYAATAHRAQGGTWDLAITVGLDGLYREAGYLVMSRGRASNWLVAADAELAAVDADLARHDSPNPLPDEEPDPLDVELLGRLNISRRKVLATARDPHAEAIQHAATTVDLPTLEAWAAHVRAVEDQATRIVGVDPQRQRARLARIDHTAHHAAIGRRVKAWDRRNIGTITSLDDATGTIRVQFVATDGRTATRTLGWDNVTVIDHPQTRTLSAQTTETLERLSADIREQLGRWDAHLARHGIQPDDRHVYESAARLAADRAAQHLTAAAPEWLAVLLETRPTDRPAATQVWDDAVHVLAAHRLRHHIVDPGIPTGLVHTETLDRTLTDMWDEISPTLAAARVWLDTHTTRPDLATTRTRSTAELTARRQVLEELFAAAPPDVRPLIDSLHHDELLPLEDTAQLLDQALATQGQRRQWVLAHWPHVVEYAQITRTLAARTAGPDPTALLKQLTETANQHLAAAAAGGDAWLLTIATQLTPPETNRLNPAAEQLLADVASYRHRWNITDPEPLGIAATDIDQANERELLVIATSHIRTDARGDLTLNIDSPPAARGNVPSLAHDTVG